MKYSRNINKIYSRYMCLTRPIEESCLVCYRAEHLHMTLKRKDGLRDPKGPLSENCIFGGPLKTHPLPLHTLINAPVN